MAMVGEQFLVGDEICGMVLSLRYPWDQVNHETKVQCINNTTKTFNSGENPEFWFTIFLVIDLHVGLTGFQIYKFLENKFF